MVEKRTPNAVGRRPDAAKRAAILTAAQHLFAVHGFTATSMDAVAAAAGTSKLTAYRHFGSKEDLFTAAIAARCEAMLPVMETAAPSHDNAHAALTAFGLAFLDLILHPEALSVHRLIVAERDRAPQLGGLFHGAAIIPTQMRLASLIKCLGLNVGDDIAAAGDLLALWRSKPMMPIELGLPRLTPAEQAAHVARSVHLCLAGWVMLAKF